jgi:outer membrane protein assembly factor BamB
MKMDPSLCGKLPRVDAPVSFTSEDGRFRGWKLTIPARRPLATPAVADGRVFLGGGFGSYDFYALDAETGQVAWQYPSPGPTAAVVGDGHIAFNTEGGKLHVLTVQGQAVWRRRLGVPLLSMPALGGGRVYVAYPDSRGDDHHYLAALDLPTGREQWRQRLTGEVITAPVLADGHVYLATLDGTLSCFRQDHGTLVWQEATSATSAPVVWKGRCYFGRRHENPAGQVGGTAPRQTEHVAARRTGAMADTVTFPRNETPADYPDYSKRWRKSPHALACEPANGAVRFAGHKAGAKMAQARENLGKGQTGAVWAHQRSRPFLWRGRLYSALGDALHCVDPETRTPFWKRGLHEPPDHAALLDGALTPPVIVNGKVFLGTISGELFCLSAESGDLLWSVRVGEPILFQPAVARGRVYVGTQAGNLFCLETSDPDDDGWLMWGAGPDHNGLLG